jgi:DNA mismatch repair protein MutS
MRCARRGSREPAAAASDALRAALTAIDPDELSPRAALEALYTLRRLLGA